MWLTVRSPAVLLYKTDGVSRRTSTRLSGGFVQESGGVCTRLVVSARRPRTGGHRAFLSPGEKLVRSSENLQHCRDSELPTKRDRRSYGLVTCSAAAVLAIRRTSDYFLLASSSASRMARVGSSSFWSVPPHASSGVGSPCTYGGSPEPPTERRRPAAGRVEMWRGGRGQGRRSSPPTWHRPIPSPLLRLHIPLIGRVEDWRADLRHRWMFQCFSTGRSGCRRYVSSPRHVERSGRISRTALSCVLRVKGYGTYQAGTAFGEEPRRTR